MKISSLKVYLIKGWPLWEFPIDAITSSLGIFRNLSPLFSYPLPKPGPIKPVPGRAPFDAPRSPSLALMGPVLSPMTPWACVARSWGRGGSGGAREQKEVVSGVYWNRRRREESVGHHHHYRTALYNKDIHTYKYVAKITWALSTTAVSWLDFRSITVVHWVLSVEAVI